MVRPRRPARHVVAAVFAVACSGATRPAADDLAATLRPIAGQHALVPALFGAVVDHGRLVAVGAVGVRKAGTDAAVTVDDQVHLGSDTKAMTGLLIGQLVAAHQLAWGDTMGQLFPDLRPTMHPDMVGVTVADLLHHTAGLPHDVPWRTLRDAGDLPHQRVAAVRLALSAKPETPPGTHYAYSNVGYTILGAIVERKTGRPWEEAVAERVFRPLGMASAGFGPPGTVGQTDEPWGHHVRDGKLVPSQSDNPPVMAPAGEVHCTMGDWAKFVALYCRTPADAGPTLLEPPALAELTTPAADGKYAGGWIVASRPWAGGRVLTHAGSNTMWHCVAWVAPGRGFAVLAAANAGGDDAAKACDEVASALIRRHAGGK